MNWSFYFSYTILFKSNNNSYNGVYYVKGLWLLIYFGQGTFTFQVNYKIHNYWVCFIIVFYVRYNHFTYKMILRHIAIEDIVWRFSGTELGHLKRPITFESYPQEVDVVQRRYVPRKTGNRDGKGFGTVDIDKITFIFHKPLLTLNTTGEIPYLVRRE